MTRSRVASLYEGGGMTTAPEWRIWTEISQKFDLNFSYNVHTVWNGHEVPLHPGAARSCFTSS